MPLEAGTQIGDLDPANPPGDDLLAESDDHIRLVKLCVIGSLGPMPDLWTIATNNTPIQQANFLDNGFIDMIKVNVDDEIEIGEVGFNARVRGALTIEDNLIVDAAGILGANVPQLVIRNETITKGSFGYAESEDETRLFGLSGTTAAFSWKDASGDTFMDAGDLILTAASAKVVLSNDTDPQLVLERPTGQSYRMINEAGLLRWYTGTPGEAGATDLAMQLNGHDFAVILGDISASSGKFDGGSTAAQSLVSPALSLRNGSAIRMNMWIEGDSSAGLANDEIYLQGTNTNFHFLSSGGFQVMTLDLSNASVGAVILGNLVGGGNVIAAADGTLILQ